MSDLFPLSPAALAVLIAEAKSRCLREEQSCHPDDTDWNGCYLCVHRRGLAAALRAAANQLGYCRAPDEFEHLYGRIVEVDDLFTIAAELEGTTTTSEND